MDMEFNHPKCQVVRMTTARKAINTVYTLHGQILEVVTSAKYLGLDISSGLSWNSHIDCITGNANCINMWHPSGLLAGGYLDA